MAWEIKRSLADAGQAMAAEIAPQLT